MGRFGWLWLMLGWLAAGAVAQAEEPAPRPVTLADVLKKARTHPPMVLAALARYRRFEALEHQARGAYLPTLTLGAQGGVAYTNMPLLVRGVDSSKLPAPTGPSDDLLTAINNVEALLRAVSDPANQILEQTRFKNTSLNALGNATVDWSIVDVARGHRVDAAHAEKHGQEHAVGGIQRAAELAAAELFVRSVAAERLIQDAELSLERRTEQLSAINALVQAGIRPSVDAQRAELEAVATRHGVQIRVIERRAAIAALGVALGEDPSLPLAPVAWHDDPFEVPTDLAKAIALAVEHRPEIRELEASVAARQAEERAARGLRFPTFGVQGSGQLSYTDVRKGDGISGDQYNASGVLYMRWSAFDAQLWRQTKVTHQATFEAQKRFEAALQQLRGEVADALYAVQRAKAQLDMAEEMLTAASTTREAQNQRYRAGVATLLELLDAEEVEQRARLTRLEAARDYDLVRARLLATCGLLTRLGQ